MKHSHRAIHSVAVCATTVFLTSCSLDNSATGGKSQDAGQMGQIQVQTGLLLASQITETATMGTFNVSCVRGQQQWTESGKTSAQLVANQVCNTPPGAGQQTPPVAGQQPPTNGQTPPNQTPPNQAPQVASDVIKITVSTPLKRTTADSGSLGAADKCYLGTSVLGASLELRVHKIKAGDNQAGHLKVSLINDLPNCTVKTGYIFAAHIVQSDAVRLGMSAASSSASTTTATPTQPANNGGSMTRSYSIVVRTESTLKPNTDSSQAHSEWVEGTTKCKVAAGQAFNVTAIRKSTASDAQREPGRTDHVFVQFAAGQPALGSGCRMTQGFLWTGHIDTTLEPVASVMAGRPLPQ